MMIPNSTLRAQFPREAQWMTDNYRTNDFAASLVEQARRKGGLTDRQIAAVTRSLDRPAPVSVDVSSVFRAFETARASGLRRLTLRLDGLCFKYTTRGRNEGTIAVKAGPDYYSTYYGRINAEGVFRASKDCDQVTLKYIEEVCKDLLAAATLYGKETGDCSCCGRTLTHESSIKLGIGPVCAERWGIAHSYKRSGDPLPEVPVPTPHTEEG